MSYDTCPDHTRNIYHRLDSVAVEVNEYFLRELLIGDSLLDVGEFSHLTLLLVFVSNHICSHNFNGGCK